MMQVQVSFGEIKRCFRLVNDLFASECFRDLLDTGIYPNMKEMTESAAVIWALRHRARRFAFDLQDPTIRAFCVGDGKTPRTGAMLAFRSKWHVVSIDPLLKGRTTWPVARLACAGKKIEDFGPVKGLDKAVIVAVHSHAPLQEAVNRIQARHRLVIAIPCCVKQGIEGVKPVLEYVDDGIWSPKNKVKIWRIGCLAARPFGS